MGRETSRGVAGTEHPLPPDLPATRVSRVPAPAGVPTRVLFGDGCAGRLPRLVADGYRPGDGALVVVTGRRVASKPWLAGLLRTLEDFDPVVVENPQPNPTIGSVQRLLERARAERPAFLVAIGGGSVLDSAKVVALLARARTSVRDALEQAPAADRLPLVALPTTSGTGAEATRTATLWDDSEPRKHALDDRGLFPDAALVDPLLAASMPPPVRASTALDALAQAVESAWSVRSTFTSIPYSMQATALAARSIEAAFRDPGDGEARARLSLASLYAGMAIACARTTLAHAISYPLTARYGLPHGYACALTLGALLRFNAATGEADCNDPRGAAHVRRVVTGLQQMLGVADPAAAERRIDAFVATLGLPPLGAHERLDLALIARDVASYDRSGNNPRTLDHDRLLEFLRAAARR